MGYVVTAPMALINCDNDTTATVLRGGAVPDNVKADHLEHLKAFNLVGEAEPITGLEPTRAGDGSDLSGVDTDRVPAKVASKDVWVAYAVAHGMSQEDAEAATKDQLIDRYKG